MTGPRATVGLTLDAGALIAIERRDKGLEQLIAQVHRNGGEVAVPAGVLAQVWRDGVRQTVLARFLKSRIGLHRPRIDALDARTARWAGELCAAAGTADVVDASVVICARLRGHDVVTSDPSDIRKLDATLAVVQI